METVQCSPKLQALYLTVFLSPDNGWQQPTVWRLYAALLKKSWMEPLFPWDGLRISLNGEQGVKKAPCVQLLARLGSELKSPESLGSAVQRSNEPSGSTVSSDIPMQWGSLRDTAPSSLIWRWSKGAKGRAKDIDLDLLSLQRFGEGALFQGWGDLDYHTQITSLPNGPRLALSNNSTMTHLEESTLTARASTSL